MKAEALNPRELFEGSVHYEIPPFQRPYVWSEEDQWEPLWQDVRRVAERVLRAGEDVDKLAAIGGHFLGAVVFKSKSPVAGDVTRHSVIDGQQRTTTLQILLDAVQEAVENRGHEAEAEALQELILNGAKRFLGRPERFKLWPSRSDREAFETAMDGSGGASFADHRVVNAHNFFKAQVGEWLAGSPLEDEEPPIGSEAHRVRALTEVMQTRLYVVAINLAGHDDDQVIFETLNDRGTPLLKADLIKNWVFQIGEQVGAAVAHWPDTHWVDFDDDWWRTEISQGRHMRSRIDIFLQYWLTMRTRSEILTDEVFREFMNYARPLMKDADGAEGLLGQLRRDADTFRSFAQLDTETAEGRFYTRVVESFELGATTPLLLRMLSENHPVAAEQRAEALKALESWVIRRTLLRYTMKDVNKLMVALLTEIDDSLSDIGAGVRSFLAAQSADARLWPNDDEMLASLPTIRLYGNVRQTRLRVILEAIERQLRTDRHEVVSIQPALEVEHLMPQGWRQYWDDEPPLSPTDAAERDARVNRLGNLTLLTKKLNGSLSNRPWTDSESAAISGKGEDANLGKRSLISKYSLLVLNKDLVDEQRSSWTDDDIDARSVHLTSLLCRAWPGPPGTAGATD
ncbi:DUF262 domain-containing protein [Nocardioides mangrovicus]|uniref:DUF262 domain-containing protein n=1 Tax=Nocardioides mangrovicus TaxID=2478913 RepID=A0A3L8NY15_9ACTN|nr:DUF262 domain-containing protein [Nocardioides mangrovicus]RLV47721.1 DUF262 domain-containing protein [Nocardioides mangrovicus]